jgi:hypothetical protein
MLEALFSRRGETRESDSRRVTSPSIEQTTRAVVSLTES